MEEEGTPLHTDAHLKLEKKHTHSCECLLVSDSQEVDLGGIRLEILLMYTLKQEKVLFLKSLLEKPQNQAAAKFPE